MRNVLRAGLAFLTGFLGDLIAIALRKRDKK